jgi:DNA repair exonuclease SbcCD nuclease subunit
MKIVHISDTHTDHATLTIPECDVLIHSGDIGNRTNPNELTEFLIWFERQPAKVRLFIAGNHDICLDKKEAIKEKNNGNVYGWSRLMDEYKQSMELIANYDVKYLCSTDYMYQGVKFWGSPYSPSFHRDNWAFNADRGAEISKEWAKIPSDVNVLITHTPVHGILDEIDWKYRRNDKEDLHVGCADLLAVIKKRLLQLRLHCSGHIHDNVGCIMKSISNTRHIMFSNAAILTNEYKFLIDKPLIITI